MFTLFEHAYKGNLEEIKRKQNSYPIDLERVDDGGRNILHWACTGKQYHVVEYLIEELGANASAQDDMGWTPLIIASSCGSEDIVELLLRHNVDVNHQNSFGCTPLHYCSSRNRILVAKLLLKHGADIHITENHAHETPLHRSTATQNHHMMLLFLKHGAEVNAFNKYEQTPLILAILNNDLPAIRMLLHFGASPTIYSDVTKKIPLDYANLHLKEKIEEYNHSNDETTYEL